MTEHASYVYSTYSKYFTLTPEEIFRIGRNNVDDSNPIPSFDENLLINLCGDAKRIFESEEIVLKITGDTIFVGDVHGSYHDLIRILNHITQTESTKKQQKILFLGDYVDRGSFSIECMTLLLTMKILYPQKFFLLRGNHEFESTCTQYGFKKEILNYHNPQKIEKIEKTEQIKIEKVTNTINLDEELSKKEKPEKTGKLCDAYFENHVNIYCYKYSERLYDAFIECFSFLPIAAIVNDTTFCIHGGLSPQLDKIENIDKMIKRPIFDFSQNQLLTDLLWSDPSPENGNLFCENPRGMGKLFNKTATLTFLKNNNLKRMIRAHECINDGFQMNFSEKCITVFSASSYDRNLGNKSAIVELFEQDDRLDSVVFCPFSRLHKFDTLYYKVKCFDDSNLNTLKAPVLSKFLSGQLFDQEKSDSNYEVKYPLMMSSRKRRASFNQTITFNTGFKPIKKNQCPLSPKDLSRNNIPRLNTWRFSDDSARESSSFNPASLPFLNKKLPC